MRNIKTILFSITLIPILLALSSCKNLTGDSGNISESLDPVENVVAVEGAESTTILVNKGSEAYFSLKFSGMEQNNVIQNGFVGNGWCIDWKVPIDADGGVYNDIKLYSTYNVEKWNPLNYLFNIMDNLKQADPDLTYREFQAVVWSLRGFPEFDLSALSDQELPSRLRTGDEANFSREKVATILEIVESGYKDFEFVEGTKYAVIAETPADVQTVITVVE